MKFNQEVVASIVEISLISEIEELEAKIAPSSEAGYVD